MTTKKIVVLFDIDHTLFNTATFVDKVYEKHSRSMDKETFYKILEEIRVNSQEVLSEKNTARSNVANTLWNQAGLTGNFYEETVDALKEISGMVIVGIFSKGDDKFQRKKIESILSFFNEENIHILLDKYEKLPEIIKKYQENKLIIVDDVLRVLYAAKRLNENVKTVFIKRKVYYETYLLNQEEIDGFTPDATIYNLRELIPFIKKVEE